MAAVWMRVRAEARERWRAWVALALLLGVMAGGATAAATGARRTETAYPRFLEQQSFWDLNLTTGNHPRSEEVFAVASGLPQVVAVGRASLYYGAVRTASGKEAMFPDVFFFGEHERAPGQSPVKIVSGRLSVTSEPDEAVVNYAMAERLDIEPGDSVTVTLFAQGDDQTDATDIKIHIVGTYAEVGQFETITGSGFPTTFTMTPAFHERWGTYHLPEEDGLFVQLRRREADASAYVADLHEELARRDLEDGLDGDPIRASAETAGVQGLNRVPAIALWLLAGAIAVTMIAVFSQLLAREMHVSAADYAPLYALGATRRQLLLISMMRVFVVVAAGSVFSAAVAFLLSPLTPVGLARIAEPDPGFALAPGSFSLGALATFVLVAAAALPAARAVAHRAGAPGRASGGSQPSLFANRLAQAPIGLSARSGLRMAMEPGRGERAVPVRTAVLGTTIAVGALAAALTFALSLDHLIGEPKLAGYTWDAGVIPAAFEPGSQQPLVRRIEASVHEQIPTAKLWKGTVFLTTSVDGIEVGGIASDGPPLSIIEGRGPSGPDEITVDRRTLRQLHKDLGDEVALSALLSPGVTTPPVPMKLVGVFAVPRIAFQGINPGQAVGLTPAGVGRVQPDGDYAEAVYVDFSPKTSLDQGIKQLRAAAGDAAFAIVSREQSATVGNVERISSLPSVLAAMMAALGIATLAHALSTTIRRRRRDLAILKTLGFIGRQVRATVAWQATGLIVTALVVGLPLGLAAGRWSWRLFAGELQVVPVPIVRPLVVAAVVAGAIVLANLIAALPGGVAARTQPALVLRTE